MFSRISSLLLAFLCISAQGQEVINSLDSTVEVHTDGSLTVHEKIIVTSAQREIRRGIVREFPTNYALHGLFGSSVGFDVLSVRRNGHAEPYELVRTFTGTEIHIGDNSFIGSGQHTYEITYKTNRQLGFFKDHNELYWNGFGNNWIFPIITGSVTIKLPPEIPAQSITAEAYTGKYGERGHRYQSSQSGTMVRFSTTRAFNVHESMTIVVTWPKGFVQEPSWIQKMAWFFQDNWAALWALIWLLIALALYLSAFIKSRRQRTTSIIFPLFYPPTGMTPAAVGFIHKKEFFDTLIAPEIVFLAVNSYLTIAYDEKRPTYTLTRTEKKPAPESCDEKLLKNLFSTAQSITIVKSQAQQLKNAIAALKQRCTTRYGAYIQSYTSLIGGALASSMIAIAPLVIINHLSGLMEIYFFGIIYFVFMSLIYTMMLKTTRIYTPEGQKIADQIAGFKMFLEATESERLKVIGTPPTKTPELYEHYLPYAMVLGVEHAWTSQFTPIFARMAEQGTPYAPLWYSGSRWNSYTFTHGISASVQSSLPSAPGSSSGAGGSGFSGGGGGGGGGRGR
jgi:hypothetical protein